MYERYPNYEWCQMQRKRCQRWFWNSLMSDWSCSWLSGYNGSGFSVHIFLIALVHQLFFFFPVIIFLPFCFIADAESRVSMYQRKVLWPIQKNTFHHLLVFDGRFVVHVGICMCKTLLIVLLVATLTDCYEQRWFGSNAWRISSGTLISYL